MLGMFGALWSGGACKHFLAGNVRHRLPKVRASLAGLSGRMPARITELCTIHALMIADALAGIVPKARKGWLWEACR